MNQHVRARACVCGMQCWWKVRWQHATIGFWWKTAAGCGCRATPPSFTTTARLGLTASSPSLTSSGDYQLYLRRRTGLAVGTFNSCRSRHIAGGGRGRERVDGVSWWVWQISLDASDVYNCRTTSKWRGIVKRNVTQISNRGRSSKFVFWGHVDWHHLRQPLPR